MQKITEFTQKQYQLEQDRVRPPDYLLEQVQTRIQEVGAAQVNSPSNPERPTALLVAAACCLIVVGICYFVIMHHLDDTVPAYNNYPYYPYETTPYEEQTDDDISDEADDVDEETEDTESTDDAEAVDEETSTSPQGGENDRRFRLIIRPPQVE